MLEIKNIFVCVIIKHIQGDPKNKEFLNDSKMSTSFSLNETIKRQNIILKTPFKIKNDKL